MTHVDYFFIVYREVESCGVALRHGYTRYYIIGINRLHFVTSNDFSDAIERTLVVLEGVAKLNTAFLVTLRLIC